MRVATHAGDEKRVFVHVDVQGNVDRNFAERVFVYNYRIYDYFRARVASLALLADASAKWKPCSFEYKLFGCEVGIRFPVVKLRDYAGRIDELLAHPNVFALVTAAHLLTQQTKGRHVQRYAAKRLLARMLVERNWDRQRIMDLFNIIDWLMYLPRPLQSQLMQEITELERKRDMPWMNCFERKGRQEGLHEGRQEILSLQLEKRFGPLPDSVKDRLASGSGRDLKAWSEAVLDAPTLDSVFLRP